MKATGIVRRIDDLGRIVIPKEIRRTLRIREGDPLEIFTEKDGEVIFKKYSPIGELAPYALEYAETLARFLNCACAVCDRDNIVAAAGPAKRDIIDRRVSGALEEFMSQNRTYRRERTDERLPVCDASDKYCVAAAAPICTMGDVIGAVLMIASDDKETPDDTDHKVICAAAGFISRHMES
ncbi:MAG: AbrB/MazE/SpoVT family DNA-binding domain-containing protein [Clostridia bacterium]|nr:AbrB/MazE/SpoVT family DNA-binding domain-containing protein [Clostridia bacterium]